MSHESETFFTAVICMDGRMQSPTTAFGQEKFNVQFADAITDAGIVGLLAKENIDPVFLEGIRFKVVDVSLGKHHSKGIVVGGHQECAGDPVDDQLQKEHIRKAAEVIQAMLPQDKQVPVIPVFVTRNQDSWVVQPL